MWTLERDDVPAGHRYRISDGQAPIRFDAYLELLEKDEGFASWLAEQLAAEDMPAYFWEHPALTRRNLSAEAEFVLIESEELAAQRPDSAPFKPQLAEQPDGDVISFLNLGGDAFLVVPRKLGPSKAYTHLAAFVRQAPRDQVVALLALSAHVMRQRMTAAAPLWLSTAGMGVPWLHVRLDGEPKYYRHAPYRSPDSARYRG